MDQKHHKNILKSVVSGHILKHFRLSHYFHKIKVLLLSMQSWCHAAPWLILPSTPLYLEMSRHPLGTLIDIIDNRHLLTHYRPLTSYSPNTPSMGQRDNNGIQYIYQAVELIISLLFNSGAQQPNIFNDKYKKIESIYTKKSNQN